MWWIDPSHKSHDALDKYPMMHHFGTEMCRHAHFCCKMVHCGIFVWCILGFVSWVSCILNLWRYVYHRSFQLNLFITPFVFISSLIFTKCGQHLWVIISPLSINPQALLEEKITRQLLSLSLDLFFKIFLFQVAFLIFCAIQLFSLTFIWLVCYRNMLLYFSQGIS